MDRIGAPPSGLTFDVQGRGRDNRQIFNQDLQNFERAFQDAERGFSGSNTYEQLMEQLESLVQRAQNLFTPEDQIFNILEDLSAGIRSNIVSSGLLEPRQEQLQTIEGQSFSGAEYDSYLRESIGIDWEDSTKLQGEFDVQKSKNYYEILERDDITTRDQAEEAIRATIDKLKESADRIEKSPNPSFSGLFTYYDAQGNTIGLSFEWDNGISVFGLSDGSSMTMDFEGGFYLSSRDKYYQADFSDFGIDSSTLRYYDPENRMSHEVIRNGYDGIRISLDKHSEFIDEVRTITIKNDGTLNFYDVKGDRLEDMDGSRRLYEVLNFAARDSAITHILSDLGFKFEFNPISEFMNFTEVMRNKGEDKDAIRQFLLNMDQLASAGLIAPKTELTAMNGQGFSCDRDFVFQTIGNFVEAYDRGSSYQEFAGAMREINQEAGVEEIRAFTYMLGSLLNDSYDDTNKSEGQMLTTTDTVSHLFQGKPTAQCDYINTAIPNAVKDIFGDQVKIYGFSHQAMVNHVQYMLVVDDQIIVGDYGDTVMVDLDQADIRTEGVDAIRNALEFSATLTNSRYSGGQQLAYMLYDLNGDTVTTNFRTRSSEQKYDDVLISWDEFFQSNDFWRASKTSDDGRETQQTRVYGEQETLQMGDQLTTFGIENSSLSYLGEGEKTEGFYLSAGWAATMFQQLSYNTQTLALFTQGAFGLGQTSLFEQGYLDWNIGLQTGLEYSVSYDRQTEDSSEGIPNMPTGFLKGRAGVSGRFDGFVFDASADFGVWAVNGPEGVKNAGEIIYDNSFDGFLQNAWTLIQGFQWDSFSPFLEEAKLELGYDFGEGRYLGIAGTYLPMSYAGEIIFRPDYFTQLTFGGGYEDLSALLGTTEYNRFTLGIDVETELIHTDELSFTAFMGLDYNSGSKQVNGNLGFNLSM